MPIRQTISLYKLNLAVDCVAKVLLEIKDDGAEVVGMMTDHGHCGGQDHFVIFISWSGWTHDRQRTIKIFCPSTNSSVQSAMDAANAVKKVLGAGLP